MAGQASCSYGGLPCTALLCLRVERERERERQRGRVSSSFTHPIVDCLAGSTGVDAGTAMTTIAQLIGWDPLTQTAQVRLPFLPPPTSSRPLTRRIAGLDRRTRISQARRSVSDTLVYRSHPLTALRCAVPQTTRCTLQTPTPSGQTSAQPTQTRSPPKNMQSTFGTAHVRPTPSHGGPLAAGIPLMLACKHPQSSSARATLSNCTIKSRCVFSLSSA